MKRRTNPSKEALRATILAKVERREDKEGQRKELLCRSWESQPHSGATTLSETKRTFLAKLSALRATLKHD